MSTSKMKLARDLILPLDFVTEKAAILGRTGSGKSYCATKMAELMLEAGAQVVALDPVGVWPGIRIGTNFAVYVFGGLRYDIGLAGKLHLTPQFDAGYYEPGEGRYPGATLQFRTTPELSYELSARLRLTTSRS